MYNNLKVFVQSSFFRFFILWAIAASLGWFLRLTPLWSHVSDDAYQKASVLVVSNLKKNLKMKIDHENPFMTDQQKSRLLKEEINQILRKDGPQARQAIVRVARQIDRKQNKQNNYPYLLASDSYNYFNLTKRIEKTGTISDTIKGSKYLNKWMLAPMGHWEPLNLHPFVGYFLHKIICFFRPGTPLVYSVSFTPLLIMGLSLIPFFIICSILQVGWGASLLGSIYFVLSPVFLKRSAFGWYDNDPYNVLFPLALLAVIFFTLQKKRNLKSALISGLLATFILSLYTYFWHGWMFFVMLVGASAFLIILVNHFSLKEKSQSKNLIAFFATILVGIVIAITLLLGPTEFLTLFNEGWTALKDFIEPQISFWPNLYIAVGELKSSSFSSIIDMTGGPLFFVIAMLGLIENLRRSWIKKDPSLFAIITLFVFLLASIVMSLGAMRFALFCLVPLSILFTLGMQCLFDFIKSLSTSKIPPFFGTFLFVLIFLGLASFSIISSYKRISTTLLNPIYNDTWDAALKKIRKDTPENSIINTWWPPGHFIKATAERRVTFDGATINFPQSYWLSNVFLATDEKEALGILRMLNNSANQAAEYLESLGLTLSDAVTLLKGIASVSRKKAEEKLRPYLSQKQITELLSLTHKDPPPSYILLYNEFIDNNIQLAFVGKWDFKKIEELNKNPKLRRDQMGSSVKDYVKFVWRMAGGQPKFSGILNPIGFSEGRVLFSDGIVIDLSKMQCSVHSDKYGKGVPFSLLYLKENKIMEKKFSDASLSYSALLFQKNASLSCVLMDTDLAHSFLMKLYFFEGKGLKYIRPFYEVKNLTQKTQIYVYEVDWEAFLEDINKVTNLSSGQAN